MYLDKLDFSFSLFLSKKKKKKNLHFLTLSLHYLCENSLEYLS